MLDSLQPQELQDCRLSCPSPSPRICSNSCPLSQWCHPTVSSSVTPFSLPSMFPSIRVFSNELALHIKWPKHWSFSFSISISNEDAVLFPLGWTDWIFLQSKGLLSLLQYYSSKASILRHSAFFIVQLSHLYMITGKKPQLWQDVPLSVKWCLLFNVLSRLVIAFLSRGKQLNFMAAVTICSDIGGQE